MADTCSEIKCPDRSFVDFQCPPAKDRDHATKHTTTEGV